MKKILIMLCCALAMISFISCSKKGKGAGNGESGSAAKVEKAGKTESAKAGKSDKKDGAAQYKVAMVTDYGDITDESFNQITYEAGKKFCSANIWIIKDVHKIISQI